MSLLPDVHTAKKHLSDTLRDRIQKYWDILKDWYKRRITKDEFDSKAKYLMGENNIQLHNDFLFAMLVKCQTGSLPPPQPACTRVGVVSCALSPVLNSPPTILQPATPTTPSTTDAIVPAAFKPPKPKKPRLPPPYMEPPYGALDPWQDYKPPEVEPLPRDLDTILLCGHDLLLPDLPTMHTRMLLLAWELGLEGVTEEAAQLLILALQHYLKNIIQALVTSQTSWKTRQGSGFQHSFGHGPSNITRVSPQRLPSPPTAIGGMGELKSAREVENVRVDAHSWPVRVMEPLNLFHLRDALMANRHCVPVHTVYSFNMERILGEMWHLSRDEEEQRKKVKQWKRNMNRDAPYSIPSAVNYGQR